MLTYQLRQKAGSMMTPAIVKITHTGNTWVLKIIGSIDITNHHLLWSIDTQQSLLEDMVEADADKFIIDLSETERIDSQGLRHLYDIYRLFVSTNIQVVLQNPNSHLLRVFRIIQLDKVFEIDIKDV